MNNPPDEWRSLLSKLNSMVLQSDRMKSNIPPEVLSTGWCGLPPALEKTLLEAEQRLGTVLPPSYRSFLSVANGWFKFGSFIERLFSVHEIDWLRVADPESLAVIQEYPEDEIDDEVYFDYDTDKHMTALRHRYYPDCLLVGKGWHDNGDMVLLDSKPIFPNGEWEAIFYADWLPGNRRYRSFREFVEATVKREEFIEKSKER